MEPGKRLAHYEILSAIGRGGMGEVWRVRDTKLDRDVAIKTLPADFAEDAGRLSRFEREAKLLAALNHPNIAAIHGLEEFDGTKALVLELVEGETLAERIVTGPVPVEDALTLALQMVEALEAAHAKGVIHRDLKPANVKVTPEGKIKVLDFGCGDVMPQLAVSSVGTLAYVLAPSETSPPTLGWVSRTGEFSPLVPLPAGFVQAQLSPDGRTALVSDRVTQVSQIDLSRGIPMQVDVGSERIFNARWHPDGRRVALGGDALRLLDLGTGEQTRLLDNVYQLRSPSFSRDGTRVAFSMSTESQSIYALLPGDNEASAVVATNHLDHSPALSPDGRWMAYVSHASGDPYVYVAGFPENDDRKQLTAGDGWEPFWSRDGRELFFTEGHSEGERVLRVVSVSSGDELVLGEPRTLFVLNDLASSANFAFGSNSGPAHDISPDGERFLMIREPAPPPAAEIVIIENWLDELERLVP